MIDKNFYMKYFKLFLTITISAFGLLGLSGCSIQVAGLSGSYKNPDSQVKSEIAKLRVVSSDSRVISVDGKSITNTDGDAITLYPGEHKVVLYVGANNYRSEINHMIIVGAKFKANNEYFLKSRLNKVWIEDAEGIVVNFVISDMHVRKSISL
jgi:hypothetical protein